MPEIEIFIRESKCIKCLREWNALFPEGVEPSAKIECPYCGYLNTNATINKYKGE